MDFGSSRFDAAGSAEFSVLMALVSARQGASVSARQQARLWQPDLPTAGLLSPASGSFAVGLAPPRHRAAEE